MFSDDVLWKGTAAGEVCRRNVEEDGARDGDGGEALGGKEGGDAFGDGDGADALGGTEGGDAFEIGREHVGTPVTVGNDAFRHGDGKEYT